MSIVMSMIQYSLPDDSSYDTYANLQVGGNGSLYGDPTQSVGDIYGEENWGYNTWDGNPTEGFDTSNVLVAFDVNSNGNEVLTVGDNSPVSYQTGSIGDISSVVLEAAVTTNAEASWSGIKVEFLKDGSVVQTVSPSAGPDVNTISTGSSNVEDQQLTITPSVTDCDEALVTGTMRLRSPGNASPSSTGMFCNIFVNGTT